MLHAKIQNKVFFEEIVNRQLYDKTVNNLLEAVKPGLGSWYLVLDQTLIDYVWPQKKTFFALEMSEKLWPHPMMSQKLVFAKNS